MEINELLKQAQFLQKKVEKLKTDLATKEYIGSANNGLVKMTVAGDYSLKSVDIHPDIFQADNREILQELLVIAFMDAKEQIEKESSSTLQKMGLPF